MKFLDRFSSIDRKIEGLRKTVQRLSRERKNTSRTVFLIFLVIFAASLLISLLAKIIITYFEDFLIYLLSFLFPLFWLSWLGVIALIAYLVSKNPEKTLKFISSVVVTLFVYAIFPVISMEPHSAFKIAQQKWLWRLKVRSER